MTDEYDRGPLFFRRPVKIESDDTPDTLGTRVNREEHLFQPLITDMVVNGFIRWDGVHRDSLIIPSGYMIEHAF